MASATLGAVIWLALAVAADAYLRHGWSATWYWTDEDGDRHAVTETTEPRVAFPNVHRPMARYLQGWDFGRLPRPEERPPIDVELRARLDVPEGPPRYLGADARRRARIYVDGRPAEDRALEPGAHRLRVRWEGVAADHTRRGTRSDSAHFALQWGPSPDPGTPVPREALVPGDGAWPAARVALWWVAALGALGWALGLFFAVRPRRPSVRRRRLGVVFTVLVVLLGTGVRLIDYQVMPEFRENADELFATWNGWSLLEDGTTRGWSLWPHSYHGAVSLEQVRFFGEVRPVISPYFEHPPLLHVLVGAAAHLGGAEHWLDAKLAHTRLVPIGLMALSLALMVAIGRRLTPRGPAPWLGAGLFAVIPIIVLQTRVIKEESLLVPLSLGMVWAFLKWRDEGRRLRWLVLASVLAGLGMITKVPAVVWVPALVMLVAAERGETKRAAFAAAIGIATAALWPLFGALLDWDVFLMTQAKQGTRPTHFNLFPRFFDSPLINHNIIGRGWTLFLWLGYVASVARRGWRGSAPVTVPLVAYLIAIAVGSGNWTFGWYIVPLYPFLCLGAGDFLARLWERPTFLSGLLFIVLLVSYGLNFVVDPHWAKQPEAWPPLRRAVTLFVALTMAPYALVQVWRDNALCRGWAKLTTALGLAAVVVLGGWFVYRYDTVYETYHDFDRDSYFHR
ncbi:MAG TPA: glycosyltransferase family 39 protein [Sandaracinaceae bacterium LLY-WYZ-13_1]|nr:glycosyltransferase family 39 protein [Sandaracinaceae bacterium LLY-WYZ-13_1]